MRGPSGLVAFPVTPLWKTAARVGWHEWESLRPKNYTKSGRRGLNETSLHGPTKQKLKKRQGGNRVGLGSAAGWLQADGRGFERATSISSQAPTSFPRSWFSLIICLKAAVQSPASDLILFQFWSLLGKPTGRLSQTDRLLVEAPFLTSM